MVCMKPYQQIALDAHHLQVYCGVAMNITVIALLHVQLVQFP